MNTVNMVYLDGQYIGNFSQETLSWVICKRVVSKDVNGCLVKQPWYFELKSIFCEGK